ncbi:shugoshin 2 [Gracilinanus agilis]|uniref:shugoshin 2 n=1 Tax=Gracilinanus agilis TaxID=191870 RepID=UPI001CFEB2B2|nr:shugoshin 2 [Gracilinanus agilis]
MFASEMEDPDSSGALFFTQRIKRYVKDKKTSKVNKLNTSLASKIKNKIINNSSIIKISLKHNNRALAQALSVVKENSRKLTTEKMLLQKEVEKLNFQNAFLRQKLNNLNKTLIEIEAFMSSNLISAIEMTNHTEDYQSPFLLTACQKKDVGNQLDLLRHSFGRTVPHIRPTQLPMRVLLTSADDDNDSGDKETFNYDSNLTSKKVPHSLTPVACKASLSNQFHLELLESPEKNNEKIDALDNPERNVSVVGVLSTENQAHPEEGSKSSSASELNNIHYVGKVKQKRSRSNSQSGNVTERKKRLPSWESSNLPTAIPLAVDLEQREVSNNVLNWSNKVNDNSTEKETKTHQNGLCHLDSQSQSASDLNEKFPIVVLPNDEQQLHKEVYETDTDLTATKVSKIVTVQTGAQDKSNPKTKASGKKAFRKVKDSSTDKNREKSKVQPKTSSYLPRKERDKNTEESSSLALTDSSKSEDQKLTLDTEQFTQLNTWKNIMCQELSEQNVVQISQQHDKKKKVRKTYVLNKEEKKRVSFSSPLSNESHQDSSCGMGHSFQNFDKVREFRRTFVVNNSNKDSCFLSQNDNELGSGILENLENELQTIDNYTKGSQNLSDFKTPNSLSKEKQTSKQSNTDLSKKPLKYSRKRTHEIIFEMNQIHETYNKVMQHKESHIEDLNSETYKPKKTPKYQENNIENGSCVEVTRKKMENHDQCSDLQKLDKMCGKNSLDKPLSLLIKPKPKMFMQPADHTQHSVPLESGLKHSMRKLESDPKYSEHQKGQTQNTITTPSEKIFHNSLMTVTKERTKVPNKRESKSKKSRKTYVVAPVDQNEIREKIPEALEERLNPCDSEQVIQEPNLENENVLVRIKPDKFTCNPVRENTSCHLNSKTKKFSPYTMLKEGFLNLDKPVARNQKLPENVTLKESPIFHVDNTEQKRVSQEKTEGTVFQVGRRTETAGKGTKPLQDLTNASLVSHNSPKSQSALDEISPIKPTKRTRDAVCYKEPSLKKKLRQGNNSKPKKSKGRQKEEDKESLQEIL